MVRHFIWMLKFQWEEGRFGLYCMFWVAGPGGGVSTAVQKVHCSSAS